MKLSVLDSTKPLGKTITLQSDGTVSKEHAQPMTSGTVTHCEWSLEYLVDGLKKLGTKNSLAHGTVKGSSDGDTCTVITEKKYRSISKRPAGTVARSKEFFEYRGTHLSMLDHDPDKQCSRPPMDSKTLLSAMAVIDDQWQDVAHVVAPSSSAGIVKPDGTTLADSDGYHLYFEAAHAEHLPEYMDALFKLAVIAGHAWVKISRAGSLLIRSYFDAAVFSPERIDFTAAPTLNGGLTQNRLDPYYVAGGVIDSSLIPEYDQGEYDRICAELKASAAEKQQDVIAKYINTEALKLAKQLDIPEANARAIVARRRAEGGRADIYADDVIEFKNHGVVTVGEVLSNPDRYDLESCADPAEPDHGHSKAKFYSNDGMKPVIHSMLHGGVNYFLHVDSVAEPEDAQWEYDDLEFYIPEINTGDCSSSDKSALVRDIVAHVDRTDAVAWDVVRKLIKRHLYVNMSAIDEAANSCGNNAAGTGDAVDERTHAELSREILNEINRELTVACDGKLWSYSADDGIFLEKDPEKIELQVGERFNGKYCKRGGDYHSIAKLVVGDLQQKDFFTKAPVGVPSKSRFYQIKDGEIVPCDYTPHLRQRYKLDVDPKGGDCPLFTRYLEDSFSGPDMVEQILLLQEILGGLVMGCFYKIQRAVLLRGEGENGKSVLLELLSSFFPAAMRCAVVPADFGNEYYRAELAGKVVNIVGELPQTKALPAANFKDIIGCDAEVTGRPIYKKPFTFKPVAGHIFASNHFPQTKDHSHGFYRRWVLLVFRNKVEAGRKIPNLGARIAREEGPQVLAWAFDGAKRLIANKFALSFTAAHEEMMDKWQVQKDSVYSFIYDDDVVELNPDGRVERKGFYGAYRKYCDDAGVRPVGKNHFYERCRTRLIEVIVHGVRQFKGVSLDINAY